MNSQLYFDDEEDAAASMLFFAYGGCSGFAFGFAAYFAGDVAFTLLSISLFCIVFCLCREKHKLFQANKTSEAIHTIIPYYLFGLLLFGIATWITIIFDSPNSFLCLFFFCMLGIVISLVKMFFVPSSNS